MSATQCNAHARLELESDVVTALLAVRTLNSHTSTSTRTPHHTAGRLVNRSPRPCPPALFDVSQSLLLPASSSTSSSKSSSLSIAVSVAQWRQLASVRLLLTLLTDARLSRSQCPSAMCVSSVLLCIAHFADSLTAACTRSLHQTTVADAVRQWQWMDECWAVILHISCSLAQQQQVRPRTTHTYTIPTRCTPRGGHADCLCHLSLGAVVLCPLCGGWLIVQRHSLSVQDCLSMLQLAISASSSSTTAAAAAAAALARSRDAGVLPSVPAHVCSLLVALIEHRHSLLVPDCTSVILALIRQSTHSLNSPSLPSAAIQRTALALARLLSRLPAALLRSTSQHGSSHQSSSNQLPAALAALLHDYVHACCLSSDMDRGRVWQSVMKPAVASLLTHMSEHDITATHLMLPVAERELFKPIIAQYKREIRYRGQ